MHLRRNRRHQLSLMTVREQVNLNPAVVERLQQSEQATFGAAEFQIMDGKKNALFHRKKQRPSKWPAPAE